MAKKVRVHIFVSGSVQGVFFRDSARRKAEKLGIAGWVKNLPDGRVEIIAEGKEQQVKELIEWAERGPLIARVDNLNVEWEKYEGGLNSFEIRH